MGKLSRTRLLPAVLVASAIGAGAAAVWAFVGGAIASIVIQRIQPEIWENLIVTPNGRVLISQYHRDGRFTSFRTLDGLPVTDVQEAQNAIGAYVSAGELSTSRAKPIPWQQRIFGFNSNEAPTNFWYLFHDGKPHGYAYFVGFNSASNRLSGFIGNSGFRVDVPPMDEQFRFDSNLMTNGAAYTGIYSAQPGHQPYSYHGPYVGVVYVVSQRKLWNVDLNSRTVRSIEIAGDVVSASTTSEPSDGNDYRRRIMVRTPQKLFVLSTENKIISSFPIPDQIRHRYVRFFNWWTPSPFFSVDPLPAEKFTRLFRLDAQGNVAIQEEVELLQWTPESLTSVAWTTACLIPSPVPAAYALFVALPSQHVEDGRAPDLATARARITAASWPTFLTICVVSVMLAVWVYSRHRRFSEHGAAVWAALVLLFGVPALVGYLLHRRWPVTEHCQNCAAVTPRDRDTCLSCGAEFPLPALKGIEVFA